MQLLSVPLGQSICRLTQRGRGSPTRWNPTPAGVVVLTHGTFSMEDAPTTPGHGDLPLRAVTGLGLNPVDHAKPRSTSGRTGPSSRWSSGITASPTHLARLGFNIGTEAS